MKKHRDADELAARLTAAANQPPVVVPFAVSMPPNAEFLSEKPSESPSPVLTSVEQPRRRRAGRTKTKQPGSEQPNDDTVPISLRPERELLTRYVVAASERTRETGRVISAQQIMLEVLERGL